ncbi:histone-lysine N-methyltransferase MECOM-like [Osmerus eperlanus]|uniref:histone-lysine N-methyltransferase MECOM-like n=1 Tax=Osmerus eperlanus TaxID=29151 RepID=UPI002E162F71
MQDEDEALGYSTSLDGDQSPVASDQMVEGRRGGAGAGLEGLAGGAGGRALARPVAWPQELACSLCKRLFSSLEQLREHEYRHTLSLMALSMDWSDLKGPHHFSSPLSHSRHSQSLIQAQSLYRPRVGEPPPGRYLCSQCPASFTLKSNADRHEKTIHFKKKLMQCVYCLKHFRDRTDLHRHLSSVHSRERGHSCPACAKAFSTQKNLATHVKVCLQAGGTVGAGPGGGAEQMWSLPEMNADTHSNNDSHYHHVNVED